MPSEYTSRGRVVFPRTSTGTNAPIRYGHVPYKKNASIDFGCLGSDRETTEANLNYDASIASADTAKGTLASVAAEPGKYSFDSADHFNGTVEVLYTVTDRGDPDGCGTPGETGADAQTSD